MSGSVVVPIGTIKRACVEVLDAELVPLHYVDLTERALARLGLSRDCVVWSRQIEDVREKVLEAGQCGLEYVPSPFCLAIKSLWFDRDQLALLPVDPVRIPGHAQCGVNGAFEALMRAPHMITKTATTPERLNLGRARGLVVEQHVRRWFEERWPALVLPPDNEGDWVAVCSHDFKLQVDEHVYAVDVAGRPLSGDWRNPGHGKRGVDFHLLCAVDGRDVIWDSVTPGRDFQATIPLHKRITPHRMVVWLNCIAAGIDYRALALAVRGERAPMETEHTGVREVEAIAVQPAQKAEG